MKFLHLTDIHLDHFEEASMPAYVSNNAKKSSLEDFAEFYNNKISTENIDAILLTGDISTSKNLRGHLLFLESNIKAPIYFILGNHDYYGDKEIFGGRSQTVAKELGSGPVLSYATLGYNIISSDKTVAIIGTDGWYDGGYSSMYESDLFMSDFVSIGDFERQFTRLIKKEIKEGDFVPRYGTSARGMAFSYHMEKGIPVYVVKALQNVAKRFTEILETQLKEVLAQGHKNVVVLTHVPPFAENSVNNGKISNGDWLPYFSNKSLGDLLLSTAKQNEDVTFTVLCGHSHGTAFHLAADNLFSYTTNANYGEIYPGRIIEI